MSNFPNTQNDTNEFSVILLLDHLSTEKVNQIRRLVPPSPVRVDPPHVTLLRGISSSSYIEDYELVNFLEQYAQTWRLPEMHAQVKLIHDHTSHLYRTSSVIELAANQALRAARAELITVLQQKGFIIEHGELIKFRAHTTIALSSPLGSKQNFDTVLKAGDTVHFSGAAILRLQVAPEGSPRQMRLVTTHET